MEGEAAEELSRLRRDNARLLSSLQSTRGNILVYLRVRPESESSRKVDVYDTSSVSLFDEKQGHWRGYRFDGCFAPSTSQFRVYEHFEPLVQSVLDGSRVCVLAYGQTGSGKTHTMVGNLEEPGISFRMIAKLLEGRRGSSGEVRLSMVEIYNEEVFNLLDGNAKVNVFTSDAPTMDSCFVPIGSESEARRLYSSGIRNRSTASTSVHEHSSRSHCLLSLEVRQSTDQGVLHGALMLVDLAGSERQQKLSAEGQRLRELIHINSSLSSLGDVLHALDEKSPHIPYRNSKLTYLLRECLSFNSKVAIIGTVRDRADVLDETRCTLDFLKRAKAIDLGRTKVMLERKKLEEENAALQDEVRRLRESDSRLSEEISALASRLALMETDSSSFGARERSLKAQLSSRGKLVRDLEQRVQSQEAELRSLRSELERMHRKDSAPLFLFPSAPSGASSLPRTPPVVAEEAHAPIVRLSQSLVNPLACSLPVPVSVSVSSAATAAAAISADSSLSREDWQLMRRSIFRGLSSLYSGAAPSPVEVHSATAHSLESLRCGSDPSWNSEQEEEEEDGLAPISDAYEEEVESEEASGFTGNAVASR